MFCILMCSVFWCVMYFDMFCIFLYSFKEWLVFLYRFDRHQNGLGILLACIELGFKFNFIPGKKKLWAIISKGTIFVNFYHQGLLITSNQYWECLTTLLQLRPYSWLVFGTNGPTKHTVTNGEHDKQTTDWETN